MVRRNIFLVIVVKVFWIIPIHLTQTHSYSLAPCVVIVGF